MSRNVFRKTNSEALVKKLVLENENRYYDIHGRFPEGSTRVNPVRPQDQFWSDYTDSAAQSRNRGARLLMDPEINAQIAADPDAKFLMDLRDEVLLDNTTGMTLSAPNKSGRKDLKASQIVASYPDEALAIDIGNAEAFQKYADTTDPRGLEADERQLLMEQENNRFTPDMDNPVVMEALAAAGRQLTGGAFTGLGNAATSSSGTRKRARVKSKSELREDANQLIAQKIMGRSSRTGAQTDGRGTDIEHIIAANLIPSYNNEGVNKYPGPKYLNRAYGDTTGVEQDRRVSNYLSELNTLRMAMDNPELLNTMIQNVPELYNGYGKKPNTIMKNIGEKYSDKFSRFASADMFV
jgi:hypothetical protein